ncbi:MAG: hypothetical protein AABY64_01475 [Bdellovibrionota bacterium]
MKSFKLIMGLGIAVSITAALVACNKKSDNNSPQPVVGPVIVPPPPSAFPNIIGNSQNSRRPPVGEMANVICIAAAVDSSGRSGLLGAQAFDLRQTWDTSKAATFPILNPYETSLGKVTFNVQPDTFDANGTLTAIGYLELNVTGGPGNASTTIRAGLDSNVKLDMTNTQREEGLNVDCNVVELLGTGRSKSTYACRMSQAQAAAPAEVTDFKINSKAQFIDPAKILKLEVDKSSDLGRLVLSIDKSNQNRSIKLSVPFGDTFSVRHGTPSAVTSAVDCVASEPSNATHKK